MKAVSTDNPAVHAAIANLQQLSELFERRREQLAREAGLTVQQWRVLEEIAGQGFMPSMFARQRESSRAAVSKILRQLQDKGLVAVGVSAENGRHRDYTLTPRGQAAMEKVVASRLRAIESVWSPFTDKDIASFQSFSTRLIERLERYASKEE